MTIRILGEVGRERRSHTLESSPTTYFSDQMVSLTRLGVSTLKIRLSVILPAKCVCLHGNSRELQFGTSKL